ncbi:MAG TPA: DUF393 domain-containing protein [Jatrophihabitans sp.]|nr:DUF393 domain-containing protein [Jatrophihabitans sp.]
MSLYYDADCGFCTRVAGLLQRSWRRVEVVPMQSVDLPALGIDPVRAQAEIPFRSATGLVSYGSDAFAAAAAAAGGPWRWVGAPLARPPLRLVARPAYRWIARHRHQLPGGSAACALPAPPAP